MRINIVSRNNGVGLERDAKIITEIATAAGHEVCFSDFAKKEVDPKEHYHLNIFLELLHPKWFPRATLNWMIPNPEWFDLRWRQFCPRFNNILCKTKVAFNTFGSLNRRATYTSFTSYDRFLPNINKQFDRWIHIAGRSLQKSTDVVYATWAKHPEFPHLTIVQDPGKKQDRRPLPNLTYRYERLDDNELQRLQNECGVHICPSETEGFGHYIAEAMSCQAIVLTTAAPPMNELVDARRGVLCSYERKSRQRFATNYYVSEDSLAEGVRSVLSLTPDQRDALRSNARAFFLSNDGFFRSKFSQMLEQCYHAKRSAHPNLATRGLPASHPRPY